MAEKVAVCLGREGSLSIRGGVIGDWRGPFDSLSFCSRLGCGDRGILLSGLISTVCFPGRRPRIVEALGSLTFSFFMRSSLFSLLIASRLSEKTQRKEKDRDEYWRQRKKRTGKNLIWRRWSRSSSTLKTSCASSGRSILPSTFSSSVIEMRNDTTIVRTLFFFFFF